MTKLRCGDEYEDWQAAIEKFKTFTHFSGSFRAAEKAVEAVFLSWYSPRANVYRNAGYPRVNGNGVNVRHGVWQLWRRFSSAAFTRDPSNGENRFFGEVLFVRW